MVAPMLRPSELDLRQVHARGETPYTERPFEDVREEVRQWFISTRLSAALDRYFRNVRARVSITLITRPTYPSIKPSAISSQLSARTRADRGTITGSARSRFG